MRVRRKIKNLSKLKEGLWGKLKDIWKGAEGIVKEAEGIVKLIEIVEKYGYKGPSLELKRGGIPEWWENVKNWIQTLDSVIQIKITQELNNVINKGKNQKGWNTNLQNRINEKDFNEISVTGGGAAGGHILPGVGAGVASKLAFKKKKKKKKVPPRSSRLSSLLNEIKPFSLRLTNPISRWVYKYEMEISDPDFVREELPKIRNLKTTDDVIKYYTDDRGWDEDKDLQQELIYVVQNVSKIAGKHGLNEMSGLPDPDGKLAKWKYAFYFYIKKVKQYAKEKNIAQYNKAVENAKYYNEKYREHTSLDLYHLGSKTVRNESISYGSFKNQLDEVYSYNKFKKLSRTKNESQSFHSAVREIKNRLSEVNRILEYTNKMRSELSEDKVLKYSKFTESALTQISEMVVGLYKNIKELKN